MRIVHWSLVVLPFCTPLFAASPSAFLPSFDDGNAILNKDLDRDIFPKLGQYAPRYSVRHDQAAPPLGCTVQVVDSLERHGARYMTASALSSANKTVTKLQGYLASRSTSAGAVPAELSFLQNVTLLTGTADLVPYGALQAYYSGRSTANVYPLLSHQAPFVRASGDESTLDDRVILTAKFWTLGFTGGAFPSGRLQDSKDVRSAAGALREPQVIFSEMANQNNTLDVSTCAKEDAIPDADGEKGAQQAYATSTILPTVGARLQARLTNAGAKNVSLSGTDLINLASICSFETLGRANVENGKLNVQQSPFCSVFNATEWTILGYAFDVGKWKGAGYGNPYYKALGQGFLRELVARFTNQLPSLNEPTSLNATIDGNPDLFPLPAPANGARSRKGPSVFFDGSHDNNIGPIAAAASLFNGPALATTSNAQKEAHTWIFSQIAPLQGKIVFEKLQCVGGSSYVRIRANGATLSPSSYCANAPFSPFTPRDLCPLDTFVKNLAFVETADEWNKCFV